eukprot:SAG31_NODE_1384_length_8578_cov_2.883359_7_plen_266_part_00
MPRERSSSSGRPTMLASETAPRSPKPGRQGKSPRKGKRAAARRNRSPGPGAYDLPGSIGSSKTGSAKYSFGTADRNAYLTQYLSKTQSQTSSAFGRGSPGPASYNTRTSITLVGRNRSPSNFSRSTRGQKLKAESPGPIYWPSIDEVSVHSRGPAYSVGSGHADPSVTSVESPGPCYDVAGERTPSKTRMPAYTMGGGREGVTPLARSVAICKGRLGVPLLQHTTVACLQLLTTASSLAIRSRKPDQCLRRWPGARRIRDQCEGR